MVSVLHGDCIKESQRKSHRTTHQQELSVFHNHHLSAILTINPQITTMAIRANLLYAALSLWLAHVTSAAVLPVLGTPHFDVAITTAALVDNDRLDPYAKDGRARTIVVSSFSPVKSCGKKQMVPYMPPATAGFQDEKYAAYGLPNGTFRSLSLEACEKVDAKHSACSAASLPVVLFSGALSTSRLIYNNILQNVAAAGYLVVSIDHPYDSDIVEFPNGTVVTGVDIENDADIALALATRVGDIAFVRQQMANVTVTDMLFPGQMRGRRAPKTAAVGHSLGGAAVATVMLEDHTISAGLNLDGSMFGEVLTAGLDRPFMLMGHENKTQETDPSWKAIWPKLAGWKKEFEVKNSAHYSFSDLPLVVSVLGLSDKLPAEVSQVLGTIEGRHTTKIIARYTTSFLDMVFKSGSKRLLTSGDKEFPEVVVAA
jgi:pimeloyl-ACP methyl ester carboxylesterase